jgi:hypothetical protein
MKIFLKLCTLVLALYFVQKFCLEQTDGFTIAKISSNLPFEKKWETDPLSEAEHREMLQILDQKFTYLASGGQCYAFVSADGQSVLKFFKHHMRLPCGWRPESAKKLQKKKNKLERDFNSYKLAFEELREETGLLYIHLNKTDHLKQTVTIVDKLGIEHRLDLDRTEFVLQKRADLVYPHLQDLMQKGDTAGAKQVVDALLEVITARCQKGIFDEDARIHRNFGLIADKAVIIDVGRFKKDSTRTQPDVYHKDLETITKRLKTWLDEDYPLLSLYLEKRLDEIETR